MSDPSEETALPASLRWLKGLVIVLTVVMIVGMVLIVGMLFVKMRNVPGPLDLSGLPAQITLPQGTSARAVTAGQGWIGVVTDTDRFLIFDGDTGALLRDIAVKD